jgi:hypothetical protein
VEKKGQVGVHTSTRPSTHNRVNYSRILKFIVSTVSTGVDYIIKCICSGLAVFVDVMSEHRSSVSLCLPTVQIEYSPWHGPIHPLGRSYRADKLQTQTLF